MASDSAVIFVGLIGVGIMVVGIMILMKQQQVDSDVKQQKQPAEVIVQDAYPPLWNAWGGWGWPWLGPYYSRIPLRPVFY